MEIGEQPKETTFEFVRRIYRSMSRSTRLSVLWIGGIPLAWFIFFAVTEPLGTLIFLGVVLLTAITVTALLSIINWDIERNN